MKRMVSIFVALVAIASTATVRSAFGANAIGYCVTNETVNFNYTMLEGGDAVFVYTSTSGEFTFTTPSDVSAWILAVGGGGAGGNGLTANVIRGEAGGGGGGGFVETNGLRLASGTYTIGVGAGGVRATVAGGNGGNSYVRAGSEDIFLAKGGGGGARAGQRSGIAGASGGGGSFGSSATGDGGAAEDGQGNIGGNGVYHGGGGGGGGAGGAGNDTPEEQMGGAGGAGKESAITGESVFYAGGGGGGSVGATCAFGGGGGGGMGGSGGVASTQGTDGLGGGGGGGGGSSASADRYGASGGSGIVIIRISKIYGEIPYPDVKDYEYTGKPITVWVGDDECEVTGAALTQTDIGTYSFTATPINGATWAGGSKDSTNYTWSIVKSSNYLKIVSDGWVEGSGTVPAPRDICEYKVTDLDDEPKVFFSSSEDGEYLPGLPNAAGLYWLKASIAEKPDYYDGAEAGPQKFRILGASESPMIDRSLKYFAPITIGDDVSATSKVTVAVANNWVADYNDGSDVRFCDMMGNLFPSRLEVWNSNGSATFSVDVPPIKAGGVFYMCWGETTAGVPVPTVDEPSAPDAPVGVSVGSTVSGSSLVLKNWIRDLSMSGWRDGESSPSVPTCVAKIGSGTVQYKYNTTGLVPSIPYDPANPPPPGIYDMRAEIEAVSGEYDWAASEKVTFQVLRPTETPLKSLAYFTPVTVTGTQAEPKSVTVTMRTYFDYTTIFNDGSDVRFCDINGNILGSVPLTAWATDGTAKFRVELPAFKTAYKFYICWGPIEGMDIPAAETPTDAASSALISVGTTVRDIDRSPLVNHWVTEPVFPSAWTTEDNPTFTAGVPAYPTSGYEFKFICRNIMTGVEVVTNELPKAAGDYQLMAFVDAGDFGDGSGWAGITNAPYEVSITTHDPAISVTRYYGAEGRVLLMNDDTAPDFEIRNQGFFATNTTDSTFWEHSNTVPLTSGYQKNYNMSNETAHILWAPDSDGNRRLWTLNNCRQGNLFPKSDTTSLIAAQNYLPWGSSTALDFDGNPSHTRHGAGQVVMMNTNDTYIISSCYDEGIGTVYFDAVNSGRITSSLSSDIFRITAWIATDCVTSEGDPLPDVIPLDEYVREFDETPPPSDVLTTNANWRLVEVIPLRIENGVLVDNVDTVAKTNMVELGVSQGAADNWFYRIVVPLDITAPVRLKIQREFSSGVVDNYARYVLLDNIIVSYPAMRAEMTTYGEGGYDSDKTGKDVIGIPNALTEAFPSTSSTSLFGRGKVSYITNAGVINPATNDFITSARFNYRWRYLDQQFYHDGTLATFDDRVFASVRLSAVQGYVTTRPLDLPGLQGDIEYWYELVMAAPYYEYHDYSGLGAGVGDYSENITNFIGRADSTYRDLPSMGTNWFVRVREGASPYERMELTIKDYSVEPATTEHLGMDLVGDHLWRGFVAVTNKTERDLTFFITGFNRQVDAATEYDINDVEFLSSVSNINITVKPYAGNMVVKGEEAGYVASVHYLTNVASYLEFQFNDDTKAVAISHADYQDFNTWTMSRRDNADKFYTSMYETNSTGIAKTRYPASKSTKAVAGFAETPRTADGWEEHFALTGTQTLQPDGFWMNKSFTQAKTPNGWSAEQGTWVSENWGLTNQTNFALQMEGCGRGSVTFNLTPTPNGLDTISFKTRLAQFHDLDDMAYCFADGASSMTNYTFVAQACFDEDEEFKNFSGEGSVSLFAGYRPSRGAYEYRVSVYDVDTAGAACCRHAIYKWKVEGGRLVAVPLIELRGDEIGWTYSSGSRKQRVQKLALGKNSNQYSGLFISFAYDRLSNKVTIIGGVTMTDNQSNKEALARKFTYSNKYFYQISFVDDDPVTTKGTYGALSRNCPARIYYPRIYKDGAVQVPVPTTALPVTEYKGGKYWKGVVSLFATTGVDEYDNLIKNMTDPDWSLPPGGMEAFNISGANQLWGLQAASGVTQNVNVAVLPLDSGSGWTNLTNVVVQTFNFTKHEFALQSTSHCHVKLSSGGTADDARMDIAVDDIYLTQWCGGSGTAASPTTSSYGYWKDFYYMGSWISNRTEKINGKVTTERVAVLAPRRADAPDRPVGIRTPYLEGYGAIMFSYKDCDPNAEILVQRLDISSGNIYSHLEDPADDTNWKLVTNFTFSALGERGTKTVYLGKRPPGAQGLLRIVLPQSKVKYAYEHPNLDPNWGAVSITDIYCYDEPPFDNHSWWGWNFLTTGWKDGRNNSYAALDDHRDGAVGAFNNTLNVDTLVTGDSDDYVDNSPFVQSPTIGNRSIGEIAFRARRYDFRSEKPSYVTVWGAKDGNAKSKEEWTAITNVEVAATTYVRYSVKCSGDEGYRAVRIGVAKVPGIQPENALEPADAAALPDGNPIRVLVDEVVIRERVTPEVGFRIDFVRPFRLGLSDVTTVTDIDSRSQQPLLNEQFGFQAEVEIRGLAEEVDLNRTPEVLLSFYPSEEPWGFANWKDAPGAVLDVKLAPAEGTNLIFRSTGELPRTLAGPYEAENDLGYRIVQYSVLVRYWDKGGDMRTHRIGSGEWEMPAWYYGFEPPADFSPFTILDTVSPGRAWINEVNFSDDNWLCNNQFIEVCFPAGYDMTGWRINRYNQYGTLEELAWLGLTTGVPSTKDATGGDPNFAFLALTDRQYPVAEGDCLWNRDMPAFDPFDSYGLQIVRPSGVIEQQIVVQGTLGTSPWDKDKGGELVANTLRERVGGEWSFVGADTNAAVKSVGAFRNAGVAVDDWNNTMDMTPARINCPGNIPDGWFLPPGGTNVWLTLSTAGGFAWIVDGASLTNAITIVVPQGVATNLSFASAPWHRLTLMRDRTNDVSAATVRQPGAATGATNRWTYAFKEEASNSASLTASGTPDDSVFERGGLDPADRYVPAIMNWLVGGTANGRPFEGSEISTNCFYQGISASDERVPLPLKERYWLDIDPTSDSWDLRGGMGEFGQQTVPVAGDVRRYRPDYWPLPVTNRVYAVSMMISNKLDNAYSRPPNRLQGLSGEKSDVVGARNWTSETFKVMMSLIKGSYSEQSIDVSSNFWPLAQFVFDSGSFGSPSGPHPFAARIEVLDPMSPGSPAHSLGWDKFPGSTYGYKWDLSHGMYIQGADMLKSTNTWDNTWEADHNDY